jgi:hypothetical protein
VQHAFKLQVIDIERGPGNFFSAFFAGYRFSDEVHPVCL